jgi:phosphatidylglycerophosphate synthase
MEDLKRRPIKTRENRLIKKIALNLAHRRITPNQISIGSIICSLFAWCLLFSATQASSIISESLSLFLTLCFIQGRLLCNLLDGMVAVEGGKKTKSGELYNEIPDRISDIIIFLGVGYSSRYVGEYGLILGWSCSVLALMTAYIRTLGVASKAPNYFIGPMAKQHRMAAVSVAILGTILERNIGGDRCFSLKIALIVILFGSIITCIRRTKKIAQYLESNAE